MDRIPEAVADSLSQEVRRDFAAAVAARKAEYAHMERILRDRDDDRAWTLAHAGDDTRRSAGLLSCGCEPEFNGKPCEWHAYVDRELNGEIVTYFDHGCWSAHRKDYDGAPDSHCALGHGNTEEAAIEAMREQEAA